MLLFFGGRFITRRILPFVPFSYFHGKAQQQFLRFFCPKHLLDTDTLERLRVPSMGDRLCPGVVSYHKYVSVNQPSKRKRWRCKNEREGCIYLYLEEWETYLDYVF